MGGYMRGGVRANAGRKVGSVNQNRKGIADASKEYTEDALKTLAEVMLNPETPPAVRVTAANCLLDRAYGKPSQAIQQQIDTSPQNITITRRIIDLSFKDGAPVQP